jgi:hypothetical protein
MEAAVEIYGFVVFRFDVRACCSQSGWEETKERDEYIVIPAIVIPPSTKGGGWWLILDKQEEATSNNGNPFRILYRI